MSKDHKIKVRIKGSKLCKSSFIEFFAALEELRECISKAEKPKVKSAK